MKKESEKLICYKGFDKDLKCKDFQFKIGETYTHDGEVSICNSGFHACTNPLDVLNYYDPAKSSFALVECSGVIDKKDDDSKICCEIIHISKEITITEFVSICADYCVNNTPSKESNSGDRSLASNSGNSSLVKVDGKESIACVSGYDSAASGTVGNWLVIAERDDNWNILTVKTVKVDGKNIKENVYYKVKNGKFVEA